MAEVNEDSRGKLYHFRLENFEDETGELKSVTFRQLINALLGCPGCKKSSTLDSQTAIENLLQILGVTDAQLLSETFRETIHFFYCKGSTTACVDYKETADDVQEKLIAVENSFEPFRMIHELLIPFYNIIDDIVDVTVCEIADNNCERFDSDYNVTIAVDRMLNTLHFGDIEVLTPLLLDIVHNNVVRARCSLECRPF